MIYRAYRGVAPQIDDQQPDSYIIFMPLHLYDYSFIYTTFYIKREYVCTTVFRETTKLHSIKPDISQHC